MNRLADAKAGWMNALIALFGKEWKEQTRSNQLLISCIMGAIFGILSPLTARYMPELIALVGADQGMQITLPEPSWRDVVVQFVKNLSQIGLLVLIFLNMGGFAREKERGTLAFLMVKPAPLGTQMIAKIGAVWLRDLLAMALATGLTMFYTGLFFGDYPMADFLACAALILFYFWLMALVGIALSAIAQTVTMSGVLTLSVWIAMMIFQLLPGIGAWSLTGLAGAASEAALGIAPDLSALWGGLLLSGILLLLANRALRRWEA